MSFKLVYLSIFINVMNIFIDASSQHCAMGFLKKESLRVIVDAPRDNTVYFSFPLNNTQSVPINESGLLVKFFIAAKFDHAIPSGWPVLQIRRRVYTNNFSYLVYNTATEPRHIGYLNVFEYDVKNMTFDVQRGDVIQVFWPRDTNIERHYSLAYSRNNSNVMLSIQIQHHTEIATTALISGDNHDLFTTIASVLLLVQVVVTSMPWKL